MVQGPNVRETHEIILDSFPNFLTSYDVRFQIKLRSTVSYTVIIYTNLELIIFTICICI